MTNRIVTYWFLLLTVFLSLHNKLLSQSAYQATVFTTKDGLSSANCRKIHKDRHGFIWITSDKGLNRFDGHSMYVFTNRSDDPNSLGSTSCNGMLEDSKGRFWINTDEGLSLFDHKKQTFTNYYPDTTVMPLIGDSYTQMAEDNTGKIWIGGYYDVLIFDPKINTFTKSGWYNFALNAGIIRFEKRNNITQSIVRKSDTELWLLTVFGLFSVHTPTMTYAYHPNQNIEDYFAYQINEIDQNGVLWIGTYDKCYYTYTPETQFWQHHACPPASTEIPDQMLEIRNYGRDTMMMMRSDQAFLYDIKTKKYAPFEWEKPQSIQSGGSYTSFAKFDNQLYLLKTNPAPFIHLRKAHHFSTRHTIPLPKGFSNNHSYVTKNGKVLTGDWIKNQVLICDKKNCNFLTDQNGNNQLGQLQLYFESKNGQQYFSTSRSVYQWNEAKNTVVSMNIPDTLESGKEREFRNFTQDNKGNLYIRERNKGIYILKKGNTSLAYFDLKIGDKIFSALYYDKATDKLWLATQKDGLFVIDPKTKLYKNYPLTTNNSAKKGYVNDISGDGQGNVFLLMPGRGLMCINSQSMKTKLYTTSDGLISDAVRYGHVSNDGLFWFTTVSGMMAFDHKKEQFYNFENIDETKLYNYRIFQDSKGNIYQNLYPYQYISLDKNIISTQKTNGRIYLKETKLFGKILPSDSIFNLQFDQNNLTFSFGYLDLYSNLSPTLEYKINNQPWQSMQNMLLSMYNMGPGKYELEVRIRYQDASTFKIDIEISPPWWQSWWFYSLLFTLISICSYWAYKARIAHIRKEDVEKNKLKERIAQIEMSALRAQMNPHFIFNCLNSINRFILVNETDAASEYLTKFSRLIRMILDASREDFISLDRELDALRLYIGMESMRFQDSFEWQINIDKAVASYDVMLPPLLLQPYVENAIWHGLMQAPADWGVKKLQILIYTLDDKTIIDISDNGIGRDKAKRLKSKTGDKHKSYGITLTEERLALMQKISGTKTDIIIEDLTDISGKPTGTKVKIIMNHLDQNI